MQAAAASVPRCFSMPESLESRHRSEFAVGHGTRPCHKFGESMPEGEGRTAEGSDGERAEPSDAGGGPSSSRGRDLDSDRKKSKKRYWTTLVAAHGRLRTGSGGRARDAPVDAHASRPRPASPRPARHAYRGGRPNTLLCLPADFATAAA